MARESARESRCPAPPSKVPAIPSRVEQVHERLSNMICSGCFEVPACSRSYRWQITGYFYEKAGGVKGQSFGCCSKNCSLPTNGRRSSLSRSFRVPCRRIDALPSALFVEVMAPVPVDVLNFNGCCYLG